MGLPLEEAAAKLEAMEASLGNAATAAAAGDNSSKPAEAQIAHDDGVDTDSPNDDTAAAEDEEHNASSSSSSGQHHMALCAEARIAELEQQQRQQQQPGESSSTGRDAFHQRLFVLLLRYKSIQGHGFQVCSVMAVALGQGWSHSCQHVSTRHIPWVQPRRWCA